MWRCFVPAPIALAQRLGSVNTFGTVDPPQLWKPASFRNVLAAGYRMLLSPYTSWYLDCGGGNWITGGTSWCAPFKSWQVCCLAAAAAAARAREHAHGCNMIV